MLDLRLTKTSVVRPVYAYVRCLSVVVCVGASAAGTARAADVAFARVAALVESPGGYSMRVESHEERGDRSEELTYAYARGPGDADIRVTILEGRGAGTSIESLRGGKVALHAGSSPFVPIVARDDPHIVTLRGNDIRTAGLESFVVCVRAHAAMLEDRLGPEIDGIPTRALVFDRRTVRECPGDSPPDAAITTDVVYVAARDGTPMLRKRYAGREVVERLRFRNVYARSDASSPKSSRSRSLRFVGSRPMRRTY